MAKVVTNETATALGLYDEDGSHHVAGAMGGHAVMDPDHYSSEVVQVSAPGVMMADAAAPVNTDAPVASGDVETGSTVSVTNGTWTGNPPPAFTYQWQVSDGEGWEDIDDETGSTLVLTEAMEGEDVRCIVTGTNEVDAETATSNPLGPVVPVEE